MAVHNAVHGYKNFSEIRSAQRGGEPIFTLGAHGGDESGIAMVMTCFSNG